MGDGVPEIRNGGLENRQHQGRERELPHDLLQTDFLSDVTAVPPEKHLAELRMVFRRDGVDNRRMLIEGLVAGGKHVVRERPDLLQWCTRSQERVDAATWG